MRVDAKALLDRLGKQEFAYKEFADRFSELELWPLFEALLKDPRLASLDDSGETISAEEIEAAAAMAASAAPAMPAFATAAPAAPSAPALSAAQNEAFSSLFARYENPEAARAASSVPAPAPQRPKQDVRAMLRELSQLNQSGKL